MASLLAGLLPGAIKGVASFAENLGKGKSFGESLGAGLHEFAGIPVTNAAESLPTHRDLEQAHAMPQIRMHRRTSYGDSRVVPVSIKAEKNVTRKLDELTTQEKELDRQIGEAIRRLPDNEQEKFKAELDEEIGAIEDQELDEEEELKDIIDLKKEMLAELPKPPKKLSVRGRRSKRRKRRRRGRMASVKE